MRGRRTAWVSRSRFIHEFRQYIFDDFRYFRGCDVGIIFNENNDEERIVVLVILELFQNFLVGGVPCQWSSSRA
ncbi:hypothetical protein QWM81_25050 [Streptomyces ficellus]|uniref:Uncharacterized protein n=1 Tax=Streptomyces ficellus TaxID=1977088 RepID=A0ABT7ZCS8_9ACTN|nr:hypothetical protein [Streptomyces ficellus]MDN3297250.1 hypothetical protein [Streptomyces ficellus]